MDCCNWMHRNIKSLCLGWKVLGQGPHDGQPALNIAPYATALRPPTNALSKTRDLVLLVCPVVFTLAHCHVVFFCAIPPAPAASVLSGSVASVRNVKRARRARETNSASSTRQVYPPQAQTRESFFVCDAESPILTIFTCPVEHAPEFLGKDSTHEGRHRNSYIILSNPLCLGSCQLSALPALPNKLRIQRQVRGPTPQTLPPPQLTADALLSQNGNHFNLLARRKPSTNQPAHHNRQKKGAAPQTKQKGILFPLPQSALDSHPHDCNLRNPRVWFSRV